MRAFATGIIWQMLGAAVLGGTQIGGILPGTKSICKVLHDLKRVNKQHEKTKGTISLYLRRL